MIGKAMMLLLVTLMLVGFVTSTQGGTGSTNLADIYNAMSKMMVKNMQLEATVKSLTAKNINLTTELDERQAQVVELQNKTEASARLLNASRLDTSICNSFKTKLSNCEQSKGSLINDKLIHHSILNASKQAHDKCLGQIQQCQGQVQQLSQVKVELQQCKAVTAIFPPTCKAWKEAGYTKSGNYVIDPDGPGGVAMFEVECEMDNFHNTPFTVMHHNSEARIAVVHGHGSTRNVAYKASIQQITELIKRSAKCEQFVKYECYYTIFTSSGYNHFWYSRDGKLMDYWGGAKPGSGKCACGMTNSCDKLGKVCNCDSYDGQWRSDAGVLTDKNTLPVTKMAFGLWGRHTNYHRLGALKCYG